MTIHTDGGLVRELPATYVQEHVEHAYSLTGHGMQGGTVQTAIVIASPRELSAGWSYTALSRARGETRLLLYEENTAHERNEFAPPDQTEKATRAELLARTEQRMTERDDEDLAIQQLPNTPRTPTSPAPPHCSTSPAKSSRHPCGAQPPPNAELDQWVRVALGERPDKPRQLENWEKAIHAVTNYRAATT